MRLRSLTLAAALVSVSLVQAGCSTSPRSQAGRLSLEQEAEAAVTKMQATDPSLQTFLTGSYGYVVFPNIGKGGLIVGGSYGRGVVYDRGQMAGYADMTQGTVGAQIGGQSFTQIIVFQDRSSLDRFKSGEFTLNANASAVAIRAGAAGSTDFKDGTAVFTHSDAGLMAEAVVGGQRFTYQQTDAVPAAYR